MYKRMKLENNLMEKVTNKASQMSNATSYSLNNDCGTGIFLCDLLRLNDTRVGVVKLIDLELMNLLLDLTTLEGIHFDSPQNIWNVVLNVKMYQTVSLN